jgi:crossover junction endodeoxyribonuclease RuvC
MSGPLIMAWDAGLNGAGAFYNRFTQRVEIHDMPTFKVGKGRQIDERGLARLIDAHSRDIDYAFIEQQWARPTDGGPQGFKLGVTYGQLRMVLAANFIPFQVVAPRTWKRFMGLTSDKDACRAAASRLLPQDSHQWTLKKHDGRAEAALLAIYALKHPIVAEVAA